MSPPASVQARPVVIPISFFFSAKYAVNLAGPKYFCKSEVLTRVFAFLPSATSLAIFLRTVDISLSKLLTPASRV